MPLIQVRDVPDATVDALKSRAADAGLTLAAYLRVELERLAVDRPMRRSSSEWHTVTGAMDRP